jgi:UDP-N-acetylmuramoyl-tripeptide--D-alanyl-D-alanine ligase
MMRLSEAAHAIGARNLGANARFTSVSSDSRTLAPGALFVALRGERFDGHGFIGAAKNRAAAAAMVDADSGFGVQDSELPALVVDDTRLALGRLAAHWRRKFDLPLIAVTGSNGKTTVKEMIAAILRAHCGESRALATEGNLNNAIGLPLTLLRLRAEHRCAVVELGMNHPGETGYLAGIAAPTVALVNNAQREHQEFMKNVADVAREHGAVFSALPPGGTAVINADDEFAGYWRDLNAKRLAKGPVKVFEFGMDKPAQVGGRHVIADFGSEIQLRTPQGSASIALHIDGRHNVLNAIAAAAGAIAAGAGLEPVVRGLEEFRAFAGRMQRKSARSGSAVIDDSYNANPDSVRAAIDVLANYPAPTVLVLGDMGEVGERGPQFHREIGAYARSANISSLFAMGELSRHAVEAFGAAGAHASTIEGLLHLVRESATPQATLLVKGSRFMRMERVVAALCEEGK